MNAGGRLSGNSNKPELKRYSAIDYIFWILLILFTNPGGIIEALNVTYVYGKMNFDDAAFALLSVCYFSIPKRNYPADRDFKVIKGLLFVFLIYFYLFYVGFIPLYNNAANYSLLTGLIKTRHTFYNITLFVYIYEFAKRRWDIFCKVFLFSSIIILILFVQAGITGRNILPVNVMNRVFVDIERSIMISEGLMPLLVPLGVVVLVSGTRNKYKYLIIAGFALLTAAYLFELWRRNFVAIFAYFTIAVLIDAYLRRNAGRMLLNALKAFLILVVMTGGLYILSPRYTHAARVALLETVSVIKNSKTTEGKKDVRMELNRPFINNLFYRYPVWGTGFNNYWRTRYGDELGFEAVDYPMLSALAMFGLAGTVVFLPVYFMLFLMIINDLKYFRKKGLEPRNFLQLMSLSFLLYFVFHFMQYFNYFIFISVSEQPINYFALSLYLALRAQFYNSEWERLVFLRKAGLAGTEENLVLKERIKKDERVHL